MFIFFLGLLFTAGLYFFINNSNSPKPVPAIFTNPVTVDRQALVLNLSGPDDNSLVFSSNLLVQGNSSPGALIIFNWNDNNKVVEAGDDGTFSYTLKLDNGVNNLKVAAFNKSGESKEENRLVYYSPEKL